MQTQTKTLLADLFRMEVEVFDNLKALETLGRKEGWTARTINLQPDWTYEPLVDDGNLPELARKRKQAILEAGIKVDYWLVGHEPETENKPQTRPEIPELNWDEVYTLVGTGLKALGALVGIAVMAAAALPVLVPVLAIFALVVDPNLIACVDGQLVEVARWGAENES